MPWINRCGFGKGHCKKMSKKNVTKKSRVLETVHATAAGLHRIGLIDKRKMEKFDLLCLKEVPDYSAE